jgi:hypothetical protein
MGDRSMSGKRVPSGEMSAGRTMSGRVCQEKECATRLSMYNDGQHCSLHAPMVTPRTRGKKIA